MDVYDQILLPVGLEPDRKGPLEHALELAGTYDARLHLLHVADLRERGQRFGDDEAEEPSPAADAIDGVVQAAEAAGVPVRHETRDGTPYEEILAYIEEEGIDLVVMGTHGKRGLSRFLLGSTAEEVLRRCPVPVVTVRE